LNSTLPGHKGYVKTSVFFTTYDEKFVESVKNAISLKYKIITFTRSRVVKELYFIEVEGDVRDFIDNLLKDKVLWYKVDVIEFK